MAVFSVVDAILMVSCIQPSTTLYHFFFLFHFSFLYHAGSGGNNHAVDHFDTTRYPLSVKLGTITPDGADVFSYDEDDMVEDPLLSDHLAHWGINITSMTKVTRSVLVHYTIVVPTDGQDDD